MRRPTRRRGFLCSGGYRFTYSDQNLMLASCSSSSSSRTPGDPSYTQGGLVLPCFASSSSSSSSRMVGDPSYPQGDMAKDSSLADGDVSSSVWALESLLGYTFRDPRLAEEALTHPSARRGVSYERLEFLGDAALGLAVATDLYLTYPGEGPGRLSLLRAANVSTEKLARAALRHGLYGHLRPSSPHLDALVEDFAAAVAGEGDGDAEFAAVYGGTSVKAPKVLADVLESVAAAVFVDSGYNLTAMWRACRRLLDPFVTAETIQEQPVSLLNKVCQQRRWALDFRHWRKGGRTVSNAFVNGQKLGVGCSDQKDIAKLNAARDALRRISELIVIETEAEAAAKEAEQEMGRDGGSSRERVDVGIDGGAATGGEEAEELQDIDGEAAVLRELNATAVASKGWPEPEEVQGAKMKLHAICGKSDWSKPIYRVEKKLGPAHDRRFICSVRVKTLRGAYEVCGGMKSKRKDAENAAASELIKGLLNGRATKVISC